MERHEEQEASRSAARQKQAQEMVRKKIAEYEKTVQAARESIQRVRKQAEKRFRSRQAKPEQAAPQTKEAATEEPQREKPAAEAAEEHEAATEPVGSEADQQPEAVAEALGLDEQAAGQEAGGAEEQTQAGEPVSEEQAEAEEQQPEELAQEPEEAVPGSLVLFDGSEESARVWKKVGAGELEQRDEQLQLRAGHDRGLIYAEARRFDDFRLEARYRLDKPETPMSLAVRFLDPEQPVPDREDPQKKYRYDNQAYVAAHTGFEVSLGTGAEGEAGTFVGVPVGDGSGEQRHPQAAQLKPGDWNELEVEVRGDDYTVRLNGAETARFTNTDPWRGKPAASGPEAGHVGFLMGEEPRQERQKPAPHRAGAMPASLAGPLLPGGRLAGKVSRQQTPAAGLTLRRVVVQPLEAAGKTPKEKKLLARKDLGALHQEVIGALARLKAKDSGLEGTLEKAYGYAVLPAVGKASLVLGAARGYGEVFEQGKSIGFTRVTQLTLGVQVGGQTFIELLVFGSKESLDAFKASPLAFNANLAIAFVRGAAGTTDFKDVTAHAYSQGGMVLEAALGGQKFRFLPETEAVKELAKSPRLGVARATFALAGRAALGLGKKISAKAGGLLKRHQPQ